MITSDFNSANAEYQKNLVFYISDIFLNFLFRLKCIILFTFILCLLR